MLSGPVGGIGGGVKGAATRLVRAFSRGAGQKLPGALAPAICCHLPLNTSLLSCFRRSGAHVLWLPGREQQGFFEQSAKAGGTLSLSWGVGLFHLPTPCLWVLRSLRPALEVCHGMKEVAGTQR